MTLMGLCLKNIFQNKARALTLGIFVLAIAFMMVMVNSFTFTVREGMQELVIAGLTGHVQLRPEANPEKDMYSVENPWEGTGKYVISAGTMDTIAATVSQSLPGAVLVPRIRATGMLVSDTESTGALLLGTDVGDRFIDDAFRLTEGRMPRPGDDHVIVLPLPLAVKLGVKTGDTVGLMSENTDGYMSDVGLTVIGIGESGMTWKYSFNFDNPYIDLTSARELLGLEEGEATDAVIYLPDKQASAEVARSLGPAVNASLLPAERVKASTYETMGSFMLSAQSIYGMIFTFFIAVITVIAGIVTMNIIFMMGLERRQEIGTMRAIGFSRGRIVGLFVTEILVISAFFGTAGAGAALLVVKWLSGMTIAVSRPLSYTTGSEFRMMFDAGAAVPVAAFIALFALLASLYPSLRASRERPADALRE